MTIAERIFLMRYISEDRRRLAAARQHYLREAAWCLVLVALRITGGRP